MKGLKHFWGVGWGFPCVGNPQLCYVMCRVSGKYLESFKIYQPS